MREWRSERVQNPNGVRRPSDNGDDDDGPAILCCVRKRPLLPYEEERRVFDVVSCNFSARRGMAERSGASRPPESPAPPLDAVVLHVPRTTVDNSKSVQHNAFRLNGGVFGE